MEKLGKIQSEIKAEKNNFNSFGKYSYRSNEGILKDIKPTLDANKCAIIQTDELVYIGDRYYVKAVSRLIDCEGGKEIAQATGYARETETKKGMDLAQITGACSSYARKYSISGLLGISDTPDFDTMDNSKEEFNPTHASWQKAKKALKEGKVDMAYIEANYSIDATNKKLIQA